MSSSTRRSRAQRAASTAPQRVSSTRCCATSYASAPHCWPSCRRTTAVQDNLPGWWLEVARRVSEGLARIAAIQRQLPPLVLRVDAMRATVGRLSRAPAQTQASPRSASAAHAVWLHAAAGGTPFPAFETGTCRCRTQARSSPRHGSTPPGMRVLDACAAPGGKTAHLAELGATDLTALEVEAARAERID